MRLSKLMNYWIRDRNKSFASNMFERDKSQVGGRRREYDGSQEHSK
jgi:hypothetical protein